MANVAVTNTGTRSVRVSRRRSLVQAAGRFVGATSASPMLLERLAPGSQVEGGVSFHDIPLDWLPEKLMLHLEGRRRPVTLDLPLQAYADSRA